MTELKLICWDLGKVFVGYDSMEQVRAIAGLFGVSPEEAQPVCDAKGDDSPFERFSRGLLTAEGYAEALERQFGRKVPRERFWQAHLSTIELMPRTLDIAWRIRKRHPGLKHAVTSDNDVRRLAHAMTLVDFPFAFILGSCTIGRLKPDPSIWQKALLLTGAMPWQCCVIDDRRENVIAARKHNMRTIHYTTAEAFEREAKGMFGV